MNVIIIAAIALVVLVVLTIIFVTKSRSFSAAAGDCEQKGGKCRPLDSEGKPTCDAPVIGQMGCPADHVCCLED